MAVSWYKAAMYCRWLGDKEHLPEGDQCYPPIGQIIAAEHANRPLELTEGALKKRGYRLPTEEEWEYACRAGTETPWFFGNSAPMLREYAWVLENSGEQAHPVGTRKPNDFGLFDTYGNATEWCQTIVHNDNRVYGVQRGGDFKESAKLVRSSVTGLQRPESGGTSAGFRIARTLD
jgi:formylglycine-generating enzyme required for sulfatase activity